MTPVDPLNRPLSDMRIPSPPPEWVGTVTTVLLFTVGIMAVFFTLIFIVAIFRDDITHERH